MQFLLNNPLFGVTHLPVFRRVDREGITCPACLCRHSLLLTRSRPPRFLVGPFGDIRREILERDAVQSGAVKYNRSTSNFRSRKMTQILRHEAPVRGLTEVQHPFGKPTL